MRTMTTISTEELRQRLESGQGAVFDVRGDVEYERAHIPGAYTAPLGSLVFRVARLMEQDSFIVVYSGGKNCDLAGRAAQRLENLKLRNVHLYEEGLEGWQAAGLPVVESIRPKTHARGPVHECRPLIVDRENAYGGAFREAALSSESAGG
jgi:rhodanese-related sulfurtransferase